MLRRTDDLLACVRAGLGEDGKVRDSAESVMSFLVLHLKCTMVEIPPLLTRHVKIIEKFCEGGG